MELTIIQSIQIVGEALANDGLKLSQRDMLLVIDAFNNIKKAVEKTEPVLKNELTMDASGEV